MLQPEQAAPSAPEQAPPSEPEQAAPAPEPGAPAWLPAVAGLAVGLLLAVIVTGLVLRLNRVSDPGLHQRPEAPGASAAAAVAAAQPFRDLAE